MVECSKAEILIGLVGVLCSLRRERQRAISLLITVGFHLFDIYLFPASELVGSNCSTYFCQRCGSGLDKKDEDEVGFWCLKDDSFGHLVVHSEGRNRLIFKGQALSYQDFKLYILRILYSWELCLNNGSLGFSELVIFFCMRLGLRA